MKSAGEAPAGTRGPAARGLMLGILLLILGAAPGIATADGHRSGTHGQWQARHPGWSVHRPPSHSHAIHWRGVSYRYWGGIWYTPVRGAWMVVRPPYGIVVADTPAVFTALTIGGLAYLYADGVYYRQRPDGYEVVPPPVNGDAAAQRLFVYPREGQSAEQQASDEYECHRWAVAQTRFDPTRAAVGEAPVPSAGTAADYERARTACLEGRGYTVR